jgi:hypothetical protein
MPTTTRTIYTFFLAETSLKAILARIRKVNQRAERDVLSKGIQYHSLEVKNPVIEELERQLSTWLTGIPAFLNWSTKPSHGTQTKNASKIKLLYWFAKISLYLNPINDAITQREGRFTMRGWMILQDTILATHTLMEVFVSEELEPDPVLWNS